MRTVLILLVEQFRPKEHQENRSEEWDCIASICQVDEGADPAEWAEVCGLEW